ncbi:Glycosyltransferase involved in cell wall bisynthesis [Fibrobacter sp. UWT2]|uniref:glycosyltransferase family 4 protein n=1 Tax=Fibrobacter sp. UWT2 TaxID=1896224 RepID=UPI0009239B29|nr:glycosyltransferase family 1 protein [Fibrobacter sp. UWT2]SHK39260.1 Glycosyltransferase involved in cell wall bisynthesis [Fibrobacter sp. UWT2]
MRIGIDIKCLRYNNSGIGRYLISLLDELQKVDLENEYFLFSPHEIEYPITNKNFKLCPYSGKFAFQKKIPGILWQQLTLPHLLKQYQIDVFWGPEQTLPLEKSGCKKVLTVHDFVYKRYPETMRKSVRWINNHIGEKSILKADVVAVNSDFTKSELLHFHPNINKNKIEIVPCGINKSDKPHTENSVRNGLLFVGSLEPRKNFKNLVKALEILDKKGIQVTLSMTGPKGWKNSSENSLLQNSPVATNIQHLGFVSDDELRNLYANSAAVIFPSVYEGFGLPVLEALNYKTPVLTTKGSVMEEIAEDCGIYFDAKDPESIAQTIEAFLNEPQDFLSDKEDKRKAILEKYQWKNSAKQLVQIFERLERSRGGAA